jgi:hypothetical protein
MNQPIKVVFLGLYFEAWDSLEEVYRQMLDDPRFEPIVVSLPRKLTGQLKYADENKAHRFFESQGIEHIRFDFGSDESSNELGFEKLKELAPDYIFTNYPWQRNYQPAIRFDKLAEISRLCYVPYFSLAMVQEPDDEPGGGMNGGTVATHLYKQRLHQLASLLFTQDALVKQAFSQTDRGESYVHFVGSPKIDALRLLAEEGRASWPMEGDAFRIIWAPHHSYSPHWLNFGVFSKIANQMLDFAKANPDIQVVLRPHPFLWGTLIDRKVMPEETLSDWRRNWDQLPNTSVDEDGSYAELFLATDLLMTDGISFLGEYPLISGKPAVFFENEGHWNFTPIGEIASEAAVTVKSFTEFVDAVELAQTGKLPDRSAEIAALRAAASPYPGEAAKRILEIVYEDFAGPRGPSKLVDKSTITETAWEFVAGREPFED